MRVGDSSGICRALMSDRVRSPWPHRVAETGDNKVPTNTKIQLDITLDSRHDAAVSFSAPGQIYNVRLITSIP